MELSEYIKQREFLKAVDVKRDSNIPFIIVDEGEFVTSEKFGVERLHLTGELNMVEKIFDCSKTNARFISDKIGTTDTKKWIGRKLRFEVYRTKTSKGEMVDALNVIDVE